ncbi:hypothetical protein LCGC14_0827640, partial [marine sediment metagenome]
TLMFEESPLKDIKRINSGVATSAMMALVDYMESRNVSADTGYTSDQINNLF